MLFFDQSILHKTINTNLTTIDTIFLWYLSNDYITRNPNSYLGTYIVSILIGDMEHVSHIFISMR